MTRGLDHFFTRASRAVRELNPDVFGDSTGAMVPAAGGMTSNESEADLQARCDRWLESRGYLRRTPKCIAEAKVPLRWYLHFPRTRGNPIVLDYLLLDGMTGCYLEVELKTERGKLRKEQTLLIACGSGSLVRNFHEFARVVECWETDSVTF